VACGDDGISDFNRIRYRHHDASVFLYAFDLIALDGDDFRRDPLAVRKTTLASLLSRAAPGLRFTEHLDEEDGALVFAHACKMGLEGIVSKRRDSPYNSGRSPRWLKSKNPDAPAVKREAEESVSKRGLRRLLKKAEDKLLFLIPHSPALRTNARGLPVKRNTLAVAR
jgi:bifunctional non-homologous end joining protein LigD